MYHIAVEKCNLTRLKVHCIVDKSYYNPHNCFIMTNQIRVSVSEAAKFFGVEQKTIRRAIKAGELRYVVVRGRYRITFESLLAWSQKRPTVRNKLSTTGIGQYVGQWRIKNKLYSPNPAALDKIEKAGDNAK